VRMDALQALLTAVFNRASESDNVWGTRASEVVQPDWTRPYLLIYLISGGEDNDLRTPDATFELGLKVIADEQALSMAGAAQLAQLFNDQGVQDVLTGALDGGDDWQITTSTQQRRLHQVEFFNQAQPIYHDGHVFQFVMQATTSVCT